MSSFFLVSTLMAGWSSSMKPCAMSFRYRNWPSRSGCWAPSVTLALAGYDLGLGLDHGVAAPPRRRRHRSLAAPTQHLRRRTSNHTALHLIHMRQDHIEESRERLRRDLHTVTLLRAH